MLSDMLKDSSGMVVAVGGPGDGQRYRINANTKTLRIFSTGPMRGKEVPKAIHALEGTYTEYDIAEFGIVGEDSIVLLKPVGSTLVNIMFTLTHSYRGMKIGGAWDAEAMAITHIVGLLRRAREVVTDVDVTQVLNKFFDAYDDETSAAISVPRAIL